VFTERGYADAGLTEIAARSGIPVGSLFQHYGGKRGLYLALWEEFREEQERRTAATLTAERGRGVEDPIALFVAGARAYRRAPGTTGGSADSSRRMTAPRASTRCAASGTARGYGATPGSWRWTRNDVPAGFG
jgi:AcrR family transcriptional regulator